jgi:hypothetical protein
MSQRCPYVGLGDVIPSRFALAATDNRKVSFIPLDYELVDFVSQGLTEYTDYGDNVVGHVAEDDQSFGNLHSAHWDLLDANLA